MGCLPTVSSAGWAILQVTTNVVSFINGLQSSACNVCPGKTRPNIYVSGTIIHVVMWIIAQVDMFV